MALPFEATVPLRWDVVPKSFINMANRNDLFSRFVNWLSTSGQDGTVTNRAGGSPDLFSRLMNRISG